MNAVPFPEDDYVMSLGRVAYAVSYLEWAVLGDLDSIPGVPVELRMERLAGMPTGYIGKRLRDPNVLAKVADPATREWLEMAGEHLIAVAKRRNSVLHAKPATIDEHQRLYRWEPGKGEVFPITEELLTDLLSDISERVTDLSTKRIAIIR